MYVEWILQKSIFNFLSSLQVENSQENSTFLTLPIYLVHLDFSNYV